MKVHERKKTTWWKDLIFYVLNGIQLWQQYNQQKEIADWVYDLATDSQSLWRMAATTKRQYQLPRDCTGKQIDNYLANPWQVFTVRYNGWSSSLTPARRCQVSDAKCWCVLSTVLVRKTAITTSSKSSFNLVGNDEQWLNMKTHMRTT